MARLSGHDAASRAGTKRSPTNESRQPSKTNHQAESRHHSKETRADSKTGSGSKRAELKEAFAKYDKDGDGQLNFGEIKPLFQSGNPTMGNTDVEKLFKTVDLNENGKVDFNELTKWLFHEQGESPQQGKVQANRRSFRGSAISVTSPTLKPSASTGDLSHGSSRRGSADSTSHAGSSRRPSLAGAGDAVIGNNQLSPSASGTLRVPLRNNTARHTWGHVASQDIRPNEEARKSSAAILAKTSEFVSSAYETDPRRRRNRNNADAENEEVPASATNDHLSVRVAEDNLRKMNRSESGDARRVWSMAQQLNLPLDTMIQCFSLFKKFAPPEKHHHLLVERESVVTSGKLNRSALQKLLAESMQKKLWDVPQETLDEAMKLASDGESGLSFGEFATWFSSTSFSEDFALDESQRLLRDLARKYGMCRVLVDKYKRSFDGFDSDSSGDIDKQEFERLLTACAKVPVDCNLPAARIQQLWRTADSDGSGQIDFEEFMVFYMKYFDCSGGTDRTGFEDYYRSLRRHGSSLAQLNTQMQLQQEQRRRVH